MTVRCAVHSTASIEAEYSKAEAETGHSAVLSPAAHASCSAQHYILLGTVLRALCRTYYRLYRNVVRGTAQPVSCCVHPVLVRRTALGRAMPHRAVRRSAQHHAPCVHDTGETGASTPPPKPCPHLHATNSAPNTVRSTAVRCPATRVRLPRIPPTPRRPNAVLHGLCALHCAVHSPTRTLCCAPARRCVALPLSPDRPVPWTRCAVLVVGGGTGKG